MALPNIFTKEVTDSIIARIHQLNATTQAKWGKMSVAQMLAHCCVTYEYIYEHKYKAPNAFMKLILKWFVKPRVVNEAAYPQNNPTAPDFIIKEEPNFEAEKQRLIAFLQKTQTLGENHFEGKESHSFGKLNKSEWNNMFYKHLDHHLRQFGV